MLKKLRNMLGRWLLDEPATSNHELDITLDGVPTRVRVRARSGVMLHCLSDDKAGEFLISENHATDKQRFWKLWEEMGGPSQAIWEDGTPFKPE